MKKINTEQPSLSTRLKDLREHLHMSKTAFARFLGLSPTHISRLENGVSAVTDMLITKVCETYSVSPDYFHGDLPLGDALSEAVSDAVQEGTGARLKAAREEKDWTQAELAERSEVYASIISRIEAGARLTEKQGAKLAEALEVGVDWLMRGDEGKHRFPADQKMIEWLWENERIRKELWKEMKKTPTK